MGAILPAQAVPLAEAEPAGPLRPESARRILLTLLLLLAGQLAAHIPLPAIEPAKTAGLLSGYHDPAIDLITGGAWRHAAITMLGLAPYLVAWTVARLLSALSPALRRLERSAVGRRRLNAFLRAGALALALGGGYAVARFLDSQGGAGDELSGLPFQFLIAGTLAAGTMLLVRLAELITESGLGNGVPLIIASGIAANLPASFSHLVEAVRVGFVSSWAAGAFPLAAIATIAVTLVADRAYRLLRISADPRRSGKPDDHRLSLAPCAGGIMPALCAAPFLTGLDHDWAAWPAYLLVFVGAAILFGVEALAPGETADGLTRQHRFILGIRPGRPTADFLRHTMMRIAGFGGLLLAFAAALPTLLVPASLTTGYLSGVALVILTLVTTDTVARLHRDGPRLSGLGAGRFS